MYYFNINLRLNTHKILEYHSITFRVLPQWNTRVSWFRLSWLSSLPHYSSTTSSNIWHYSVESTHWNHWLNHSLCPSFIKFRRARCNFLILDGLFIKPEDQGMSVPFCFCSISIVRFVYSWSCFRQGASLDARLRLWRIGIGFWEFVIYVAIDDLYFKYLCYSCFVFFHGSLILICKYLVHSQDVY